MRLGFHYHVPAEVCDGSIWLPGYLGRFIDSLAMRVERLDLFLHEPRSAEKDTLDYAVQSQNARLFSLGPRTSVPDRLLHAGQITEPLRKQRGELDALLIRGPSPLLPAMACAAGSLPTALLLVGDYLAGIDDQLQPFWRKGLIRLWASWNTGQQLAVAKRGLTFVNSHKLYDSLKGRLPNLVEVRTTTLGADDFYQRLDTCQAEPYHILYTGRMDRAKGLFEMLDMVKILSDHGENVILELVGWSNPGDTIIDELHVQAGKLGVADRIQYLGFKSLGPELFHCYQNADVYVLASKSSEGFPRTIWEAMAHSLPVVATRVGSIPDFIEGAAELINPNSTADLAAAVSRLIHQPDLRRAYIEKGWQLARSNTLEAQAEKLITDLRGWLAKDE